jgi:hypothetical protein
MASRPPARLAGLVPALENLVDGGALPRGGGFGIERIERAQPQDGLA